MENRLARIYAAANGDIEKKLFEYLEKFKQLDEKKRAEAEKARKQGAENADTLAEEWARWRRTQIFMGQNWKNKLSELTAQYLEVNKTAVAYVNGQLPEIAARNYNAFEDEANAAAKEYGLNEYSFNLVDENTVKKLATSNKTLLPYKEVDGKKDARWNSKKVNAQILQGILQGESMDAIAARLSYVTEMNAAGAIRNARTAVTSAECAGRQLSYIEAEKGGMIIEREWLCTNDSRRRDWHWDLNGTFAAVDKPWKNDYGDIMYPGDPHAHPANVYNCRCSIAAKVVGFKPLTERDIPKEETNASEHIKTIDFKDAAAIIRELEQGEKAVEAFEYEVCYTVTSDGKVWRTAGESGSVAVSSISSSLAGSYSYHNHPKNKTWYSFSAEDAAFFISEKEKYEKASDDIFEYVMIRTSKTLADDYETVYNRFKEICKNDVRELAWEGEIDVAFDEYHETMKILSEEYKFYYERMLKNGKENK